MKKQNFFMKGLPILVSAIVLFFAACTQPTNFSDTKYAGLNQLDAPTGLVATTYASTGVIHVAWNPVANADSYRLFRRTIASDGSESVVEIATSGPFNYDGQATSYADYIAYNNEFENGAGYIYRVVAVSNYSTTGSGILGGQVGPQFDGVFFMQNNYAESEGVRFEGLRAQGDKLATPSNVQIKEATINGYTTYRQVSWTVDYGVNYRVEYSYGGNDDLFVDLDDTNYSFNITDVDLMQKTYALNIPAIYGEAKISVQARSRVAVLNGDGNGAEYYLPSDPVIVKHSFAKTSLATPTGFGATIVLGERAVDLEWDKMEDAKSYRIFRLKASSDLTSAATTLYEAWTEITKNVEMYVDEEDGKVYAKDSIEDVYNSTARYYKYAVISVDGDLVSLPASATPIPDTYTMPVLTISSAINWDYQAQDWDKVKISWNNSDAKTYTLSRAPMRLAENSNNVYVPYDGGEDFAWEPVSIDVGENVEDGSKVHVVLDKPAYRRAWKYRLQAYDANDKLKGTSESKALAVEPYNNDFAIGITLQSANTTSTTQIIPAYEYEYVLNVDSNKKYQLEKLGVRSTEVLRVSRAPADAAGTRTGAFVTLQDYGLSQLDNTAHRDNPGNGYFIYKAEMIENNAPSMRGYKIATTNVGTAVAFTASNLTRVAGTGSFSYAVDTGSLIRIQGAKLVIRYASVTADSLGAATSALNTKLNSYNPADYTEKTDVLVRDTTPNSTRFITESISTPSGTDVYWGVKVAIIDGAYTSGSYNFGGITVWQ